jgi:quinol-cytochrome oxidoreductase complex cytochrome b subunit
VTPTDQLEVDGGVDERAANERAWVLATRVTLGIVAVLVAVLVVTGILLVFSYRPDVTAPFAVAPVVAPRVWSRTVHRLASELLLLAFVGVAVSSAGLALVRRRLVRLIAPLATGATMFAALITGFLLPWDQLAMYRVTVGENITGYHEIVFTNHVKYVLVGNHEIGASTFARWFWIHTIGVTLLLVVLLVVIARQARGKALPTLSD